jgi:hypothetical protein
MPAARTLVLALVFASAGCAASNNRGQIEGKWRFETEDPRFRDALLVFGEDGVVRLERAAAGARPVSLMAWRYKLLAGDAVDFYDLKPDATDRLGLFPTANGLARTTVRVEATTGGKFEGRAMTVLESDGRVLRLTWVP